MTVKDLTVRVINADVLDGLRSLDDDSVQCCVTSARTDGRFVRGQRSSPRTEFKKGQHWRPRKPHWHREWLVHEYIERQRSAGDIAKEAGCTDGNILFWLNKHGIPRRDVSSARSIKHWGAVGAANPMFGKTGSLNPRYVDGSSPDRQRSYVQAKGREFLKAVYARDEYRCRRCGAAKSGPRSIHAHHIKPWAGNPDLRFDTSNAVTLCRACHLWVHSRANVAREWLA